MKPKGSMQAPPRTQPAQVPQQVPAQSIVNNITTVSNPRMGRPRQ